MPDLTDTDAQQTPATSPRDTPARRPWRLRNKVLLGCGSAVLALAIVIVVFVMVAPDWASVHRVAVQPFPIPGTSVYPGIGAAKFAAVTEGPDGSVVAVGSTSKLIDPTTPGLGGSNAFVVRSGANGKAWSRIYGGSDDDVFNGVAVQPDGTIIAVGYTNSFDGNLVTDSTNEPGAVIAAISPSGKLIWHQTLGNDKTNQFTTVALAPNGDIIVAGQTNSRSLPSNQSMNMLLRFSAQGELLWSQAYGPNRKIEFTSLAVTMTGHIIAAGYSTALPGSGDGFSCAQDQSRCGLIVDITSTGDLVWAKTVTAPGVDQFTGQFNSVSLSGNNIIAVGEIRNNGCWAVMLGPDGNTIWNNTFADVYSNDSKLTAATPEADGNSIIVGFGSLYQEYNQESACILVISLDLSGKTVWSHAIRNDNYTELWAVTTTRGGDILAAGYMTATDSTSSDAYLVALNPDGTMG